MDRGAWWATVLEVAKSWTQQLTLSRISRGDFCISQSVFFFFKLNMGLFLLMSWILIQYHWGHSNLSLPFPTPLSVSSL